MKVNASIKRLFSLTNTEKVTDIPLFKLVGYGFPLIALIIFILIISNSNLKGGVQNSVSV